MVNPHASTKRVHVNVQFLSLIPTLIPVPSTPARHSTTPDTLRHATPPPCGVDTRSACATHHIRYPPPNHARYACHGVARRA